ncbi:MAG: N-6 DNA methylase [Polyangiales bacterium]
MAIDLPALIAFLANRDAPRTEAVVQADVRQLLLSAPLNLNDDVLLESQAGGRKRIDVEVGATIIEVKKDLRVGNVRADAVTQLAGYVRSREEKFATRFVGVLTDGAEWRCYHLAGDGLVEVSHLLVQAAKPDVDAFLVWLEGVLATTRDVKPTPDAVRERLGAASSAYAIDRATLAALYEAHKADPSVYIKRRLWARLLETALGTQFVDSDELFVEHTLLVNSAEIIAHAVIGLSAADLAPRDVLTGVEFDEASVYGVVEADFFDWVVEVPRGDAFVRALGRRLARFDWSAVEHDVLKVLYESIIGAETRKRLGEYYTPDWLAEQVVEAAVTDPLAQRVLDPSCGSGTFLFHAVKRYMAAAKAKRVKLDAALRGLTAHVVGMDLHPVAVTLARVTYLLAIGRAVLADKGHGAIRIPVFLGDSMQWRRKTHDLLTADELVVEVNDQRELFVASDFRLPNSLLGDAQSFDDLLHELAKRASQRKPGAPIPSISSYLQPLKLGDAAAQKVADTFKTMCQLHDQGRDHIWSYYIRNMARPLWLSRAENQADVLVGNPPWLSYRFMPAGMQKDFREMSASRDLWAGAKVATSQDLSGLFIARSLQLYLKEDGAFAFVVPDAVLDRDQFAGFRAGVYRDLRTPVTVHFSRPWNLRRLRPHFFPRGAAVVFGRRNAKAVPLPSASEVWTGRLPSSNASWAEVEKAVTRSVEKAPTKVAEAPLSPHHKYFRQGATIVPRVLFMVERKALGPLGGSPSRVPVRSVRSASEKKPWKDLPGLTGVVEKAFVRPVHLGETVLPYRTLEPRLAVLPISPSGDILAGTEALEAYSDLSKWWHAAEDVWNQHRSSDRLTLGEQLDYQGKLRNQFPQYDQRIVYCASGMHLCAARVLQRRALIEHSLYWAKALHDEEAFFLCAILNAACVTAAVRPLMSYGKDERHIDKYIWRLPIPEYDEKVSLHVELAKLGQQAEEEIAELALDDEVHFAASRRVVREHLAASKVGQTIEKRVAKLLKG